MGARRDHVRIVRNLCRTAATRAGVTSKTSNVADTPHPQVALTPVHRDHEKRHRTNPVGGSCGALWRRAAVGIARLGFPTHQPGNCPGQTLGRPPGLDEQPTTGLSAFYPPAEMATPTDEYSTLSHSCTCSGDGVQAHDRQMYDDPILGCSRSAPKNARMGAGRNGGRGPGSLIAINIFLRGSGPDGYSSRGPSMTDSN